MILIFFITKCNLNPHCLIIFLTCVLYEVVSKYSPYEGRYHELYGGFYQGFYKLFGYDYEIFPERMNRGWSVEMLLKPRLVNEYIPTSGETTLNKIYPQNKNIFFYLGARAENKFYHHFSSLLITYCLSLFYVCWIFFINK